MIFKIQEKFLRLPGNSKNSYNKKKPLKYMYVTIKLKKHKIVKLFVFQGSLT